MGTPAVLLFGGIGVLARHARLIREARARGFEVLAITTGGAGLAERMAARAGDPANPLSGLTDWIILDSPAVEGVVAAVTQRFAAYSVAAAISCGEIFVEACGQLADLWGLPGPGLRASRVCRSKQLQRSYLAGVSPRSVYLPPQARADAPRLVPGYPAVVKPTGRMSSQGVRRVDSEAQLVDAVAAIGPGEGVLLEELVTGPEFSVEALVREGRVFWTNITRKLTTEGGGPYFTEMRHVVPADALSPDESAALLAVNQRVLDRLAFGTGITHAEFRLVPGRGPVLMEVAARVPGDGITLLFHLATGKPVEPVLLDLALGHDCAYPAPSRRAVHEFLQPPPGILADVQVPGCATTWIDDDLWPEPVPAGPHDPPRLAAAFSWLSRGAQVRGDLRDSGDRAASVIVDLPLAQPVGPAVGALAAAARIDVKPQE